MAILSKKLAICKNTKQDKELKKRARLVRKVLLQKKSIFEGIDYVNSRPVRKLLPQKSATYGPCHYVKPKLVQKVLPYRRAMFEGQSHYTKPDCISIMVQNSFDNYIMEPALNEFQNLFVDQKNFIPKEQNIINLLALSNKNKNSRFYKRSFNSERADSGISVWSSSESSSSDEEDSDAICLEDYLETEQKWCDICLVWTLKYRKHAEIHYEESLMNPSRENSVELSVIRSLLTKYLTYSSCTDFSTNQKEWFCRLISEILGHHKYYSASKLNSTQFSFVELRNLIYFNDYEFSFYRKQINDDRKSSVFYGYINTIEQLSALLHFSSKQDYDLNSLQYMLQGKTKLYENCILKCLSRLPKTYCNLLQILSDKWRESVRPSRELMKQATNMIALNRRNVKSFVEGSFLKMLLVNFGAFMESFHGGRLPSVCVQAVVLIINDMLKTLIPKTQHIFEVDHLNNLASIFLNGGWLDMMLMSKEFNGKLHLPMESVNKFLTFLEIFNWRHGFKLDLNILYKKIYGYCFPDFHFDIFDFERL